MKPRASQRRRGFGFVAPLQPSVPRRIIDIAASSSVAHYGPVEVLRLPVGCPPDDETNRPSTGFTVS